jgi:hypothetical protein
MQSSLITYAIYQVLLFDIYEVIIRLLRRKFNINVKNEVNGAVVTQGWRGAEKYKWNWRGRYGKITGNNVYRQRR